MSPSAWRAAWLLALCALLPFGAAHSEEGLPTPPQPVNRLNVTSHTSLHQLSWRDAEDVLEGALLPLNPQVGSPLTVSVRVGTLHGARFDGPVSLTIRAEADRSEQTRIVEREGERWLAEFIPTQRGPHQLTVAFQSTRHKVLQGGFRVHPASVSRSWAWALGGLLVVGAVGFGALRLLRKKPEEPPPAPAEK